MTLSRNIRRVSLRVVNMAGMGLDEHVRLADEEDEKQKAEDEDEEFEDEEQEEQEDQENYVFEAAVNLRTCYLVSGDPEAAQRVTERWLVLE